MTYPATSTQQGILDGLNYVLSGPGGLGQDYSWFNDNGLQQYDLTGNYRLPFTQISYNDPHVPGINLYVAPISLSTSEMIDGRTFKFTFASSTGTAQFVPGQGITVSGVADSFYNDSYITIGVVECTDTYVTVRTSDTYAIQAPSTGGTVGLNSMDFLTSTDCNGRVTVTGGQQGVIISTQLNAELFVNSGTTGSYYYQVSINRYKAISNNDPTNPDFLFVPDNEPINGIPRPPQTLAFKEVLIPVTSLITSSEQETIFTSIIDQPGIGYYWYILEVKFIDNSGGNIVTNMILNQRSFTAQVFKP